MFEREGADDEAVVDHLGHVQCVEPEGLDTSSVVAHCGEREVGIHAGGDVHGQILADRAYSRGGGSTGPTGAHVRAPARVASS